MTALGFDVRHFWRTHKEQRTMLTGLGWTVLMGSPLAWYAGVRLGWVELRLAAITALVTMAVGAVFAVGRARLAVRLQPQRWRIRVGERTAVDLHLSQGALRKRLLPVTLEIAVDGQVQSFDLAAGKGKPPMDAIPVAGARRGVVAVGPARVVAGDPLGLVRRTFARADRVDIFVHPPVVDLGTLGSGLLRDLEGQTSKELSMSDLAFHALREYVHGDDRRYIHWRSSAKMSSARGAGQFMVRQFRDTRRTHVLVVVDGFTAAYADPDDFETAVSAGASIALRAIHDDLDTTLLAAAVPSAGAAGERPTDYGILDACSQAELDSVELARRIVTAAQLAPGATFAVVVTGANSSPEQIRRAFTMLPAGVGAMAVRVDPFRPSSRHSYGDMTLVDLRTLADLRGFTGGDE